MTVLPIRTEGLGDTTYVLGHEGHALVVDPQRDIDRTLRTADESGWEVRWVFDTHLHNDYVSGARWLARSAGAELVLPAGAGAAYPHTPAFHGEPIADGPFTVLPLHTPGHTPEHTSFLVSVDGEPVALFSGGSLLVGSAGRTDLLGPERADQLARLQFRTLRRLAELPDEVGLYPTHGEGSFCTASGAGRAISTIGQERRENPLLSIEDEDDFVRTQLGGLQPYPRYYAHMGPLNLLGPPPMPAPAYEVCTPSELADRLAHPEAGEVVVDLRPASEFAAAHLPGTLSVPASDQFGVWVGWLVPFGTPLTLVADRDQDLDDAYRQLARVGYDEVTAVFHDLAAWIGEGRPIGSHREVTPAGAVELLRSTDVDVLDVRAPGEVADLPVPGAVHRYLPDLVDGPPPELHGDRPVLVVCGSGYRSQIAASLLLRQGLEPIVVTGGGAFELVHLLASTRR